MRRCYPLTRLSKSHFLTAYICLILRHAKSEFLDLEYQVGPNIKSLYLLETFCDDLGQNGISDDMDISYSYIGTHLRHLTHLPREPTECALSALRGSSPACVSSISSPLCSLLSSFESLPPMDSMGFLTRPRRLMYERPS